MRFRDLLPFFAIVALTGGAAAAGDDRQVNLYSYREPVLIQPILERFTEETGIRVNAVYAQKGVLERLKAEGENSPADVVLTADIGRLDELVEADLVRPVRSSVLDANIPSAYRHPEGLWFGLTTRARVIVASKDRVASGEISSYADLADPRFKGRICSRSGKHEYMVSLIAAVIAHNGEDRAEAWLRGVRANLARKPQGNDRAQARAIYEGICDIALLNTYYVGAMMTNETEPDQKNWARAVRVVFPDQGSNGTHVNVSGAAVTRSAKNFDNAVRLLEFLSGDQAQQMYADQDFEYPVKSGVPLNPVVAAWGTFKADDIDLVAVARYRASAARLVDRVGYDHETGS
jgi:iron(III) transport system substrate-binding protein